MTNSGVRSNKSITTTSCQRASPAYWPPVISDVRALMFRWTTIFAVSSFASNALAAEPGPRQPSLEEDQTVIAVALEDFSKWKKATFGEFNGVLAVEAQTLPQPDTTVGEVLALASNIRNKIDPALATAFAERNHTGADALLLIQRTRWAQSYVRPPGGPLRWQRPPAGAKAVGQLTLPGYSPSGTKAIIQLHHSWSVHGAVVTYVLIKKGSGWRVSARDQSVAL